MKRFILLALLAPLFAGAQHLANLPHTPATDVVSAYASNPALALNALFAIPKNDGTPEADIITYYSRTLPEMQHRQASLTLKRAQKSLIGTHYFFEQRFAGLPVYNAYLQVNVNPNGVVLSAFSHLVNVSSWQTAAPQPDVAKGEAMLIGIDGTPTLIYKRNAGYFEQLSDASGNMLRNKDTRLFFSNDDTTVSGKVFLPDPISPISKIYGQDGKYQNYNDSDFALLNNQRVTMIFPATLIGDSFYLQNRYANINDFSYPFLGRAASTTPDFSFTRKQPGFKETMALFHITNTQAYIQSIGFDSLVPYQLSVDAHASTTDESFFSYSPDTSLHFGLGNVPDAEDGDIIVHEYTHAISHSLNANGIVGNDRRAIEEGNSDVMALTASRQYTPFNWKRFANWDCPNPVSPGFFSYYTARGADTQKKYSNRNGSDAYYDSEIWSSCLADIVEETGRDVAIRLLLTSVYSYTPNITMPQAATLYMQADSILYNKSNSWKIGKHFVFRELGDFPTAVAHVNDPGSGFELLNTQAFAEGLQPMRIRSRSNESFDVLVLDMQGNEVQRISGYKGTLSLEPSGLSAGMYLLHVRSASNEMKAKVLRLGW